MPLSKIEVPSLDVGQLGSRNIVINGDMRINQRQLGVTSITGNTEYMMVDRFDCFAGTGAYNAEQSTDAPSGFSYSLKATCTSVGTDDSEVWFQYKPEAQDLVHLDYGSSDAKDFTLSFWVKSTTTGQAGIYFYQGDGARAYQGRYTINSSNTWEYKSVTVPGDPSGLFNNDNGIGLEIRWYLSGKTGDSNTNVWGADTLNRSPSTWDVLSTVGNVFAITGVQLEVGEATPFEHENIGTTLQKCQRYYQKIGAVSRVSFGAAVAHTTGAVFCPVRFMTTMRTTPSQSHNGSENFYVTGSNQNQSVSSGQTFGTEGININGVTLSVPCSVTVGNGYWFNCKADAVGYIAWDAEL